MCCTWLAHGCARATWAYVLETVRGAVRRLSKISVPFNAIIIIIIVVVVVVIIIIIYYYYYYYYYYYNEKHHSRSTGVHLKPALYSMSVDCSMKSPWYGSFRFQGYVYPFLQWQMYPPLLKPYPILCLHCNTCQIKLTKQICMVAQIMSELGNCMEYVWIISYRCDMQEYMFELCHPTELV